MLLREESGLGISHLWAELVIELLWTRRAGSGGCVGISVSEWGVEMSEARLGKAGMRA